MVLSKANEDLMYILHHPNENGIVIFVSAFLFTLSMYHFLLFFQHKDKVYLLYSLYTFIVFVYTYYRASNFFLTSFTKPILPYLVFLADPIKWLYTTIYVLFSIVFVDLHKYFQRWYVFFKYFVLVSFVALGTLTLISVINNNTTLTDHAYNFVYLPITFVLGLILLYLVSQTKSPVKNYILIGSGVFLLVTTYSHYLTYTGNPFRILFYFSIIFETIFFALGLGAKQRIIQEEKNKAQLAVIKEHQINLELQSRIKSKLNKEVAMKTKEILELTKLNQEEEKRKLEIEYGKRILELRMRALQTQMNPHFLFNSLNSIKHFIIKNKKEDAAYFLSKLSKLIRKILDNSQLKEISLKEELNIMQIYVEVENIRLHKQIDFTIHVADNISTRQTKLPPIVLQPFIENSIWHGLALKNGEKTIHIEIQKKQNYLLIAIEDNGIGREQAAINNENRLSKKESLGIDLTKERLEVYTVNKKGKVKIEFQDLYQDDIPSGTRVLLSIPIE